MFYIISYFEQLLNTTNHQWGGELGIECFPQHHRCCIRPCTDFHLRCPHTSKHFVITWYLNKCCKWFINLFVCGVRLDGQEAFLYAKVLRPKLFLSIFVISYSLLYKINTFGKGLDQIFKYLPRKWGCRCWTPNWLCPGSWRIHWWLFFDWILCWKVAIIRTYLQNFKNTPCR